MKRRITLAIRLRWSGTWYVLIHGSLFKHQQPKAFRARGDGCWFGCGLKTAVWGDALHARSYMQIGSNASEQIAP
jgi:hypothetical protein